MADLSRARSPVRPFRLLDLPPELQNMIFAIHYKNTSLHVQCHDGRPKIMGLPVPGIEQTCRRLRDQSLAVLTKIVGRKLIMEGDVLEQSPLQDFCLLARFSWVRHHILSLQITHQTWMCITNIDWPLLLSSCSNLEHIELRHVIHGQADPRCMHQYQPLDSDDKKRRLAVDVAKSSLSTGYLSVRFESEFKHLANTYEMCQLERKISISSTSSIVMFNKEGDQLYHKVREFRHPIPYRILWLTLMIDSDVRVSRLRISSCHYKMSH